MPSDLLELTPDGRHELTARERGLSLPQRWLLVRVNGQASLADLARASTQADALQRLPLDAERLVKKGLLRWVATAQDTPGPMLSETGWAASAPGAPEAPTDVAGQGPGAGADTGFASDTVSGFESTLPPEIGRGPVSRSGARDSAWMQTPAGPAPPERRARKTTPWLAVAALAAAGLVGLAVLGWGPRGGSVADLSAPTAPAVPGPLAGAPSLPAARLRMDPVLPTPAPPPPAPLAVSASATPAVLPAPTPSGAAPTVARDALASALPPAPSGVTAALPPALLPGRDADLSAVASAPLLVAPLPALPGPAAAAPPALAAAPAAAPPTLEPVFSPPPRLPREWLDDTRPIVRFDARLTVDARGSVSQVAFSGTTSADTALVRAARQSLLQWRFPEGAPGRTHVVEMVFRAE